MSIEKMTLHVERSDDGETEFARVADILDHLATQYAWEPYVYGFLITRASEARCVDRVYEVRFCAATAGDGEDRSWCVLKKHDESTPHKWASAWGGNE